MECAIKKPRIPKEFLGAFKQGHRKWDRDFIDHDYTEELLKKAMAGDKEAIRGLEMLAKINNEIFRGVDLKDGTDILKTPEERKDRDHSRYARKNDALSLRPENIDGRTVVSGKNTEDEIIRAIDIKNERKDAKVH